MIERNKRINAPNSALLWWQFWSASIPSPWGPQQALASVINNTVTNSSLFGLNSLSYLMVSVLIFLPLLLKSPPKKISYSQILAPESDSIIMWVTKVDEYTEIWWSPPNYNMLLKSTEEWPQSLRQQSGIETYPKRNKSHHHNSLHIYHDIHCPHTI